MSSKTKVILLIGIVLFSALMLSTEPTLDPALEDCSVVSGVLDSTEVPDKINLSWVYLEEDSHRYLIREGIHTSDAAHILAESEGKNLEIGTINHFSLLDPNGTIQYVAWIVLEGDTVVGGMAGD
ncbi:hypothetical protein [Phaeocystidibacter marisrubri]|uniref:Uncharacterized protein n=1 Tax=Phaeocystidibacter marisrubri TaxID=1577780 RepID=A0A6L3ZIT3_9FLAO|nr:hypothetical protein [Phaeocystidibacter marisrubri]KAB2817499.1 hypothetical protein F8C82_03625 [Phaeocystidibacter marisrubri]GGH75041.1 hypothetical protein GCM10011318_21660 [Phaeocystidibacter marisrubri]